MAAPTRTSAAQAAVEAIHAAGARTLADAITAVEALPHGPTIRAILADLRQAEGDPRWFGTAAEATEYICESWLAA